MGDSNSPQCQIGWLGAKKYVELIGHMLKRSQYMSLYGRSYMKKNIHHEIVSLILRSHHRNIPKTPIIADQYIKKLK